MNNNTVLLVDDYEDARHALRFLLEHNGYTVLEASDGETAVRLAKEHLPSFIFMDYRMPGIDGFEATRQLRDCAETKHLIIVILSAYCSDKEWMERDLYIFFLPRYSPHLNKAETYWRKAKYEWFKPKDYASFSKFHKKVHYIFNNVGSEYKIAFKEMMV